MLRKMLSVKDGKWTEKRSDTFNSFRVKSEETGWFQTRGSISARAGRDKQGSHGKITEKRRNNGSHWKLKRELIINKDSWSTR